MISCRSWFVCNCVILFWYIKRKMLNRDSLNASANDDYMKQRKAIFVFSGARSLFFHISFSETYCKRSHIVTSLLQRRNSYAKTKKENLEALKQTRPQVYACWKRETRISIQMRSRSNSNDRYQNSGSYVVSLLTHSLARSMKFAACITYLSGKKTQCENLFQTVCLILSLSAPWGHILPYVPSSSI